MQVLRTVIWVVITAILVSFIAMNWGERAFVTFWPLEDDALGFTWPVAIIALFFFLLGLVPMWLVYRARNWQLTRRITSLESSLRAAAAMATSDLEPQTDDNSEGKTED